MKKIFLYFAAFILFFFSLASVNKASAVTCTSLGAFCSSSAACRNIGGTTVTGTTGCSGITPVCCQENTCDTCASKNYQCGTFLSNCNKTLTCGTSTGQCTNSNYKCNTSTHTCTAISCESISGQFCLPHNTGTCSTEGATTGTGICPNNTNGFQYCCKPITNTYTCTQTSGQYCATTCNAGDTSVSGTCQTGNCCKVGSPPPPNPSLPSCTSLGGTCTPICAGAPTYPGDTSDCTPKGSPYICCLETSQATYCPVCSDGWSWNPYATSKDKQCFRFQDSTDTTYYQAPTRYDKCDSGMSCFNGKGCAYSYVSGPGFTAGQLPCTNSTCRTAIGDIKINPQDLIKRLFAVILTISGALAVLLIIMSGYRLTASQGNPEAVQNAREQLTAAVIGLIFVILSFTILQFIGINILNLTGQ